MDLSTEAVSKIDHLNKKYQKLRVAERIAQLYRDFPSERIMVTSSFAATSGQLLREISLVNPNQRIFFIDTGNHFPETLDYKRQLTDLFQLKVESIRASKEEREFIQKDKTWMKNPDFCCSINKVKPLNKIKDEHSIWVSGLMGWQNEHRAALRIFEMKDGLLKFHPLMDITRDQQEEYMVLHQIPLHPLVHRGYESIGCTHCTKPGEGRSGRWEGIAKNECGLHL